MESLPLGFEQTITYLKENNFYVPPKPTKKHLSQIIRG